MGLDVFYDGGRTVLVHLQRLMVLLLGLSLSTVAMAADFQYQAQALEACEAQKSIQWPNDPVSQNNSQCQLTLNSYVSEYELWRGTRKYGTWTFDTQGCETGDFIDGECVNQCDYPDYLDPQSGECLSPADPGDCFETGEIYDSTIRQCVPECAGMVLDGFCLEPYEDDSEDGCTPENPGFVGSYGHGNKKTNVCAPAQQECKDSGGTFGIVNGEKTCLPEGYGAPQCQKDSISEVLVNDGFGFFCESPNQPEPEEEPEEPDPNVDTDGDGEPDEYDRTQDPDAGNKQRDEMIGEQKETNDALSGLADRLENIGNVGKSGNESLESIDDGIGGINDKLEDLTSAPDGGFDTDGITSIVPTMGESSAELASSFENSEVGHALGQLVSIPESTACPIYQIPATDYTPQYAMDIHCQVFEDYRGVLSVLFLFFWTGTALFLFFKA